MQDLQRTHIKETTMATKKDITNGLEFLIQESRRIGATMPDEGWAQVQDHDGWKNTEVLAHVASISSIVAPFVTNMVNAGSDANTGAGVDIDTLNAGLVGARSQKSVEELVAEIETGYRGVIDWANQQTDDFFAQKRSFAGYHDVTIGDLAIRMVVLHGLSHIYSAYAAVFNAGR
jgi:hypothetical protein